MVKSRTVANRKDLANLLLGIWSGKSSFKIVEELNEGNKGSGYQPYLQFDSNKIRAKNYIGFIQSGEDTIEIYPKVFKHLAQTGDSKKIMLKHVFYWFSYYFEKWAGLHSMAGLGVLSGGSQ